MTDDESNIDSNDIHTTVSNSLAVQKNSITALKNQNTIDEIVQVASVIAKESGQVIFTGIGKSGDICKKISSTFNSIGISSYFIHPVESFHGDLGVLSNNDVVIFISNSGNTEELVDLFQILRSYDSTTISITSDPKSKLGRRTDYHINTRVSEEGSVVDLVPMASATATMVIGDCLANILMEKRDFTEDDFIQYHPGGTIGKKLDFEVEDLTEGEINPVTPQESLWEASVQMSEGKKGIVAVVNNNNTLLGVVTDGDLRRAIRNKINSEQTNVGEIMTSSPITMLKSQPAIDALEKMEKEDIGQVVLVDEMDKYQGIVHMRDLVREGIS
jgi:arabinose-5-phosphate isomerase